MTNSIMQPTLTSTDATLGAIVTDIDLANLTEPQWNIIEDSFHEYVALVFPNQNLTEEEQISFAKRFGDIELLRPNQSIEAVKISNQNDDGTFSDSEDIGYKNQRGNETWHTDSSYMPIAAKASILSAQVIPAEGGETELADMSAAYEELNKAMRDQISDLRAYHSLYQSQAKAGYTIKTGAHYGYHNMGAPLRPLIKIHPVTGRKSLFIGRHAYQIAGMECEKSQKLLDELLCFACQPPRIYTHKWHPGDVIMWDNRCVLHRARPYQHKEVRTLRHTRVAGDPKTELAKTYPDNLANDFKPSSSNRPE